MCDPYNSSSLFKEWNSFSSKLKSIEGIASIVIIKKDMRGGGEKIDFTTFLEFLPYIEEIYLTGGEPLLIKEQYYLLEFIVKEGFASNIKIRYNTNITKYDKKVVASLEKV